MTMPGTSAISRSHEETGRRAAAFFEKRRFGVWSAADQAELDAWLAESALNHVAYLRVEWSFSRAEHLATLSRSAPAADRTGFPYRHFVFPLLAAAVLALIAVIAFPFVVSLLQPPDRIDSTDVGGRTLLSFSDRTQIELNTNTAMRFRMTTAERTVWLEKGEAWFHVAHDPAHPFTVIVGKHRVTDLGTEFLVRRDADDVDVTLLNGRAALSAGGVQTATLKPGDEAIATPVALTVSRRTPQELADALAWRRGMLVFRDTKLSEVVKEFNRYNATKLVIADPGIADEKITANAKTDDYESFLQLAEVALKLRVDREAGIILISRGANQEKKTRAHIKHAD